MDAKVIKSQCIGKTIFEQKNITAELEQLPKELWTQHVNKSCYEGGWSVVALRTLKQNEFSHPILQCYQIERGNDWVDLAILNLNTHINALVQTLPFAKKAIRLMKLEPGGHIKQHRDHGLSIEHGEARFHIPLQSSDNVEFISDGQSLNMSVGELWYINANELHSVKNKGSLPRINLVIDCAVSLQQWQDFVAQGEVYGSN